MKSQNKLLILKNKIYNSFMVAGNKHISEKTFLKSFKVLQKNTNKNHKDLFKAIIVNTAPIIQMKQIKKKKRKTIKEFPFVLNQKNRITLSIKTILKVLSRKKGLKFHVKFPTEILSIVQYKSDTLKVKEKTHDEALIKKKYVFFRWFC